MWFLYAEILVLLAVAFAGGCGVSACALRLIVRRTQPDVAESTSPSRLAGDLFGEPRR